MPEDKPQAPVPKNRAVPAPQVKVRVVKQPISEGGRTYFKGDTFDVDPDRADALGELVVPHQA